MKVKTHRPNSVIWLIAFVMFLYGLIALIAPLPYSYIVVLIATGLLLLGTTVI
jgi:fatty acid desaturase